MKNEKRRINNYSKIRSIALLALLMMVANTLIMNFSLNLRTNTINEIEKDTDNTMDHIVSSPFENNLLFSDTVSSLEINESAVLSKQERVFIGNGENPTYSSKNLSLYIDDTHDWQAIKFNASITGISDERDWAIGGGFGPHENLRANKTVYQTLTDGGGPYGKNQDPSPTGPTVYGPLNGQNSDYMRLHFVSIAIEARFDFLYIWDQNNQLLKTYSGDFTDVYTPWFNTSSIKLTIGSDGDIQEAGFEINLFQLYNGSMHDNWSYYRKSDSTTPYRLQGSADNATGRSSVYASIDGAAYGDGSYTYYENDESGFFQNYTIPRGRVLEAWLSMDYYLFSGIPTNDIYLYFKINGETVYTRGFNTITNLGKNAWHSTGLISTILWENTTQIFDNDISNDNINISFGLETASSVRYSGFDDLMFQRVYFDTVKLILKTRVNSTDSDVNITINGTPLEDDINEWGKSTYEEIGTWTENPLNITFTTESPKIEFDIESHVYGVHYTQSRESQNGYVGKSLKILSDDTISWEFYHNVYRPADYQNYEYIISKPLDWNITSVKDSTGLETPYEGGLWSDDYVKVNETFAYFPGWWRFTADSSNLLDESQTTLWNKTEWIIFTDTLSGTLFYDIGDNISIRTKLDESKGMIPSIENTWVNISIYHPNSTLFRTESVNPDNLGNVQFSNITVGIYDTTGGIYSYKIIWTNGTSAGGLNGTFEVRHNFEYSLQYPNDASVDLITEKYLGDIIAIRVILRDAGNNYLVSGAGITLNYTSGPIHLIEISTGIYDTSLDTIELGGVGTFYTQLNISKPGFYNISFTLTIQLNVATKLKILTMENIIELGDNFTVSMKYSVDPTGIGINDALIQVNMSTSEYFVTPKINQGEYLINISTGSITKTGYFDLIINASRDMHDTQELLTRIQITPREVYFKIFINGSDCSGNQSWRDYIGNTIEFNVEVYTASDDVIVPDGDVVLTEGSSFEQFFDVVGTNYELLLDSLEIGLGFHYMNIIFNKSDYQTTSVLFILDLRVRGVTLQVFADSTDITTSRSWTDNIASEFLLSVVAIDEVTHNFINTATISITNGESYDELFIPESNSYNLTVSSADLGIGLHYLTIVFEKDQYPSVTITIQFRIERIEVIPEFHEMDSTIITNPQKQFESTIYLTDSVTGLPIEDANVTYVWLYGSGLLEELGNGYYKFTETVPNAEGTFTIDIIISAGDTYLISSLDLTIISQKPEITLSDYWWVLIPVGVVLAALIAVVVKQNVINPRKEKELEQLKQKTQVFDDVTNIRGVMVIQKMSGLLLYKHIISGIEEQDETLFTGFLNAIMMLTQRITPTGSESAEGEKSGKDSDAIEFVHEKSNILVMDGDLIRMALILEKTSSVQLKEMTRKFIKEFEGIYGSIVTNWDGDVTIFDTTTSQLVEEIFNLSLLKEFKFSDAVNRGLIEKKIITPHTVSERVYGVIQTLEEERKIFHLKTVISLTPVEDRIAAKDVLLKFIKNKLLVPASETSRMDIAETHDSGADEKPDKESEKKETIDTSQKELDSLRFKN